MAKITVMLTATYDTSDLMDELTYPPAENLEALVEYCYDLFADDVVNLVKNNEVIGEITHIIEEK